MKPVIIYTDTYDEKSNILTIDKDKFESIIDQVYQAGVEDGKKNNYVLTYPSGVRDFTYVSKGIPISETATPHRSDTTITC